MDQLLPKIRSGVFSFAIAVGRRPSVDDVHSVVRGSASGVFVTTVNALLYAILFTDASNINFMLPWLAVTLTLCGVLVRKSTRALSKSHSKVSRRAHARLIAFTCVFALPWSALAIYVIGLGRPGDALAALLICTGMSTGGVFMLHRTLAASLVFYCTILLCVIVSAHIGAHPSVWPITAFASIYGVFLAVFAYSTGETARDRDRSVIALSATVGDLQQARHENDRLANRDTVTGLPNRKSLNEALKDQIAGNRATGAPFTLLCLDLDHFKNVNDVYGHAVGDKLLSLVSRRLKYAVKPTDIVARFGGDEFAVILSGTEAVSDVENAAIRIISAVTRLAEIEGIALHPATSIGAASCPRHSTDAADLLVKADLALNKAKDNGRGRIVVFDQSLRDQMLANDRIETALRSAIEQREIRVAYQPKYRLRDGVMVGAEALVRWSHPNFGNVSPDRFLPIAAERGILPVLTRYIADEVANDIRHWRDLGFDFGKIAVNVHPSDLKSPDALLETIEYLEHRGVTHNEITLEITEGCFVGRGTDRAFFILDCLAERGFELSLDDFGTGHASLSHLKKLPVSEIKIDKSFIDGLEENANDRSIVAAIAELARGMKLRSVAEGVETETQRRIVQELGVTEGQGYLWAPAVKASRLFDLAGRTFGSKRRTRAK